MADTIQIYHKGSRTFILSGGKKVLAGKVTEVPKVEGLKLIKGWPKELVQWGAKLPEETSKIVPPAESSGNFESNNAEEEDSKPKKKGKK